MSTIGQLERETQKRVIALFHKSWAMTTWATGQTARAIATSRRTSCDVSQGRGYEDSLISKALHELNKAAGNQTKSLYDINKDVYTLLRTEYRSSRMLAKTPRTSG